MGAATRCRPTRSGKKRIGAALGDGGFVVVGHVLNGSRPEERGAVGF